MTLNTNIKNWLAQNAGTGTCFSGSGKTYTDADGISHTGRTGDILNAFYTAHQVAKYKVAIIAGTSYAQLKAINSSLDIDLTDVGWAYANDGGTGSTATYCIPACVPVWTCIAPGIEGNQCNNTTRANPACNSVYKCNVPSDGFETDQYGNERANPACNPCEASWQCEIIGGQYTGWEEDGCGNRHMNAECAPLTNGTLNTDTNPRRAYIVVDGQDSKNVTPAVLSLTPGMHRIEYILNGYETLIKDIDIHQGELIITVDNLVSITPQSSGGAALIGLAIGATLLKSMLS